MLGLEDPSESETLGLVALDSEYDNGYLILNDRNPNQCLDRFWTQVEGKVVWYSNHIHGKPTQRFDVVNL